METKKQKLIKSLKLAINALKNDTIFYDWTRQESCNCGIVSQAVLGKSSEIVSDLFQNVIGHLDKKFEIFNQGIDDASKKKEHCSTWKDGVKFLCPIIGKSNIQIFDELTEAGLSKDDIVHLEYLENPAILRKSGIKKSKDYYRKKENLILYLTSWIKILEEGIQHKEGENLNKRSINELQAELLNAEAEEKYEYAATLRDEINLR